MLGGKQKDLQIAQHGDVRVSLEQNPDRTQILTQSGRRLQVGKLWDVFFDINSLKLAIYMEHCEISTGRREKKWLEYAKGCMSEVSWGTGSLVYMAVIPYSSLEYIGETKIGLRRRVL